MITELKDKLEQIQKSIIESKDLNLKKIEDLSDQARQAFDEAIVDFFDKPAIMRELAQKKKSLRAWRAGFIKTVFPINIRYIISMPFIYGMIIPFVIFHLCLEIYHQICFRIYGIPRVHYRDYFVYDRGLLPYLNWFEKVNCVYCSYGNNLLRYATEIAGRTERYWCPIKYASHLDHAHSQYHKFVGYLDAKEFREKWNDLRDFSDISDPVEKPRSCTDPNQCDFIKK